MPLSTGDVVGMLADNLRLRGSVLPIPARNVTRWARGLGLPTGGETVLYTGQMYQLVPYIEALVKVEQRAANSPLARFTGLGWRINRLVPVTRFMARPPARARAPYEKILRNVAALLSQAGVEFGYLYRDDLYSGALAYDMGADEVVAEHARRVQSIFVRHGVKKVITVDPHTTNMLRSVYPKLVDGYDVQVSSYLEVLARADLTVRQPQRAELTLHDSCVFARYENVVDQPRALLAKAGVTIREPASTGVLTWCCGGPVESLYPEAAQANAKRRVAELRQAAPAGVTMCPLCLVNLGKAAGDTMRFTDISEYLRRAYGSPPDQDGKRGS